MSPRTGRPKADNPKERSVRVRFNDEQYERLETYCKKHGTSKAETIRNCVVKTLEESNDEDTDNLMEKSD